MKKIGARILATFVYNAGAVLPAASVLGGWPVWKAAVVAGLSAAVELAVKESQKYLNKPKDDE